MREARVPAPSLTWRRPMRVQEAERLGNPRKSYPAWLDLWRNHGPLVHARLPPHQVRADA